MTAKAHTKAHNRPFYAHLSHLSRLLPLLALSLTLWGLLAPHQAQAQEVLNIYSGRHYPADKILYQRFEAQTGIKVRILEGKTSVLLERLKLERENSPADLFITVDAGNLWRAAEADLLQPVSSAVLQSRIPAQYRNDENLWFGFATRNRIAFYNPARVGVPPTSWQELTDSRFKNKICVRSSSNIYNLSLLASFIELWGEAEATKWAQAIRDNMARDPSGGDTDQIRAVAAGVCDLSIGNHYYYARLLASDKPEDKAVTDKVKPLWLGENDTGVHANISGAGVLRSAKNKQAAIRYLEFLASAESQEVFGQANNEYPVVLGVAVAPVLEQLGQHKTSAINVSVYGKNQPTAQRIYDSVGWR